MVQKTYKTGFHAASKSFGSTCQTSHKMVKQDSDVCNFIFYPRENNQLHQNYDILLKVTRANKLVQRRILEPTAMSEQQEEQMKMHLHHNRYRFDILNNKNKIPSWCPIDKTHLHPGGP
ncbi:conserved hypothetical protein [Coccidioides posadasii str. Silveira]|uniref:Uncharacterized protein n=1 Tax=Coccidioides posadasii (strain RMSCC 757 / Silveira) TaxID=443226 RepID=E9DJL5_COCPS|nr:conserved hypothetical protein [Coccidioides posadasii str. Silveira]